MKIMMSACALAIASSAFASPLFPGQTTFPASSEPDPIGGFLVASLTSNFVDVNGLYTGFVTTQVFSGDITNPFSGGLTFVYTVHNNSTSTDSLGRFTALGFGGLPTDVSFGFDNAFGFGGGVIPYQQDRDNTGSVVGWSFGNIFSSTTIGAGQFSARLVVQVPVNTIVVSTGNVIDGSISTMDILAPIPTPGAGALFGLGAVAAFRRRR